MTRNDHIGIRILQSQSPWPKERPDIPEDWHGWLCIDTQHALAECANPDLQLIVECGTWMGLSARVLLEHAPNADVVCIDTWEGSPEHFIMEDAKIRLPGLKQRCHRNLWSWRDRVVLHRRDSLVGLSDVYALGLKPNLIYLDTKHTYGRVAAELALCLELFPEARVVLDDYTFIETVKKAVDDHAALTGRPGRAVGIGAFIFEPWRQV